MSLLMERPVNAVLESIEVPLESYLYLMQMQRKAAGHEDDMPERQKERLTRNFGYHSRGGKYRVTDRQLGTCKRAWRISEMKAMLDEAGLPWEQGEAVETIFV